MIDHGAMRCPFCGRGAGLIYVSAHYQCAACGQVVESCCTGELAQGFQCAVAGRGGVEGREQAAGRPGLEARERQRLPRRG